MRRSLIVALACACTLSAVISGAGSAAAADHKPVTITFWSAYTARELKDYQQAFVGFHKKYPWITVKGTGNIQDDKISAAIAGGNAPDALLSFSPNNTGKFCSSGAWHEPQRSHQAGQARPLDLPQGGAFLLRLQGRAVLAARAGRLLRHLPEHEAAQGRRLHEAAEDALRAHGDGQEADSAQAPTARSSASASTRCSATTRSSPTRCASPTAPPGSMPRASRCSPRTRAGPPC